LRSDLPLAAVRDAITIVRALLAGNHVNYRGKVFSAINVKLEYDVARPGLPLLMAARGEQAVTLCGQIADGLMISNMCPLDFTRHAVDLVHASARGAQRLAPAEVVQYIPCAVRPDRSEACRLAREAIGEMLPGFWSLAQSVPAAKAALLRAEGLSEEDFSRAVERLRSGQTESCDDRFVQAFAIAGTAQDCLAQARWYGEAGATELALSFAGDRPEDDIRYLGDAMRLEVSSR
jgi:5,10-methylenetetrahydromethanopterin reductase